MSTEDERFDPEVQAFMRRIMDALGVQTAGELTNLLAHEGVLQATDLRKVHRWVSGESAPNHKATLRLLERANYLKWDDFPRAASA
jgi:hypothetical protein